MTNVILFILILVMLKAGHEISVKLFVWLALVWKIGIQILEYQMHS